MRKRTFYAGAGTFAAACMAALVFWSIGMQARGDDLPWLTSYEKALAAARARGKVILADFTGSDWCPWCVKLKREVFHTPEFEAWAEKNVVLLMVDFPRDKKQPEEVKKRNRELARKYGVRGLPTVLFLDGEGREIGRTGYVRGGPAVWLKEAEAILSNRPAVTLAAGLVKAREEARKTGKILCVLVPGADSTATAVNRLLADPGFIGIARYNLVTVVYRPRNAGAADKAAFAAMLKRCGADTRGPFALLEDEAKGALLGKVPLSKESSGPAVDGIRKALPAPRYDGEWLEDFDKAAAIASRLGRPLLLNFTGSDWCPWCVKLDFPRKKKLPEAVVKQNRRLLRKYGVRGFPTVVIVNAAGYKLGTTGYMRGGPGPFIKTVAEIIGK